MLARMRTLPRRAALVRLALIPTAALGACTPAPPRATTPALATPSPTRPASAPIEAAEEPVAQLRTGELRPIEHPTTVEARTIARFSDDRYETLALEMVLPLSAAFDWS